MWLSTSKATVKKVGEKYFKRLKNSEEKHHLLSGVQGAAAREDAGQSPVMKYVNISFYQGPIVHQKARHEQ